jgi:DNA-binding NarL/FixJ family response regulator
MGFCSYSKTLFVIEIRAADIAEAALSTGGWRYIVKSDASRELLSAIKAVLEDKRFISSFFENANLRHRKSLIGKTTCQF